jgi:6-phosphogluconolactonase (cycloisomerase 2 family)
MFFGRGIGTAVPKGVFESARDNTPKLVIERGRLMRRFTMFVGSMLAACIALSTTRATMAARTVLAEHGAVYVMTNDPSGNAVLQFHRAADGALTFTDRQSTRGAGGTGNGVGDVDPLGSQDSLIANGDGSRLLATNAGSDAIAVLGVTEHRLTLLDTAPSGGDFPNSIALWNDLVYVLNAHGTPRVSGFRLAASGTLRPLPGSTRLLPGGTAAVPHDVRFGPDGTRLIVTEDGTNQIDVFDVGDDGLIAGVTTHPSSGAAPFGLQFARSGAFVVTEAASASVSSYGITSANALDIISPSVANGQAASCWISLTPRGQAAFVSNTARSTLSSYQVGANGQLALVAGAAASTGAGSAPIDSALSDDNRFLYVIDSALGRMVSFRVNGTSLAPLEAVTRLPRTVQGIVAR